jgi:hypothetical protein
VKILAGLKWDKQFSEFVETFGKRRREFEVALAIHTAVGVDEANIKLNIVDGRTAEINQKYVP